MLFPQGRAKLVIKVLNPSEVGSVVLTGPRLHICPTTGDGFRRTALLWLCLTHRFAPQKSCGLKKTSLVAAEEALGLLLSCFWNDARVMSLQPDVQSAGVPRLFGAELVGASERKAFFFLCVCVFLLFTFLSLQGSVSENRDELVKIHDTHARTHTHCHPWLLCHHPTSALLFCSAGRNASASQRGFISCRC